MQAMFAHSMIYPFAPKEIKRFNCWELVYAESSTWNLLRLVTELQAVKQKLLVAEMMAANSDLILTRIQSELEEHRFIRQ